MLRPSPSNSCSSHSTNTNTFIPQLSRMKAISSFFQVLMHEVNNDHKNKGFFGTGGTKGVKQKSSLVTSVEPRGKFFFLKNTAILPKRKKKNISHFVFCQKAKFQWMKNAIAENPQRFPAFDPCESAMEPGGQITC